MKKVMIFAVAALIIGVFTTGEASAYTTAAMDLINQHKDCEQCNLQYAPMANKDLTFLSLKNADLRWSNLTGADLRSTNLTNAKLNGADLTGAAIDPKTTILTGATLGDAIWTDGTKCKSESVGRCVSIILIPGGIGQ